MKFELSNLNKFEELREVLYHLKEIVEAQDAILEYLSSLDRSYQKDSEDAALALSRLEVEVIDHLGYHLREIKKPLRELVTSAYKPLKGNVD